MADSDLSTSISALKTKIVNGIPTANVNELVSLARAVKALNLGEDKSLEDAINARANALVGSASADDVARLAGAIKQVLNPASITVTTLSTITGDLIPDQNIVHDLGSSTNRFKDLHLSGNTAVIGDSKISDDGTGIDIRDTSGNPRTIKAKEVTIDDGTGNPIKMKKGAGNTIQFLDSSDNSIETQEQASAPAMGAYNLLSQLPTSGVNTGTQAYVAENNKLYLFNGTGWYNIALISNPITAVTGNAATYELANDGTPLSITLSSSDPDGIPLQWSHQVTSGSLGGTTITNVNNVFTITPSTNNSDAGDFTVSFIATNGENQETSPSSFTLFFSPFNLSTTISPSTLTTGFEMNKYRTNAISDDGVVLATTHQKDAGATNEREVILTVWRKDVNGDFQEEYTSNLRTDPTIGTNKIDGIRALSISGDGNYIAIIGYNSPQYNVESNLTIFKYTGTTWNIERLWESLGTNNGARMGSFTSISFSEDGKIILMGEIDTPASNNSGFFNTGGSLYTQYSNYDNCGSAIWIGGGDSFNGSSYDHINNAIDWTGTNHNLMNGFFRRSAVGPNALPRDGAPDQFTNMGLQMLSNTKARFGDHVQLLGPNGQFSLISCANDNRLNSSSTNVGALILCSRPSSGNGQYSYISTLRVSQLKSFKFFHGGFDGTNLHVLISGAGSQPKAWYYKSTDSGASWTLMKEFTSADANGISGFADWANSGFGWMGLHINHAGTRIAIGGLESVSFFSGSDSTWTLEDTIQHPTDTNFGYDGIVIPNGGNGWENATFAINSVDSNGDRQLNVYKHST